MKTFIYTFLTFLLIIFFVGCSKDSDQTVESLNAEALKLAQAGQKDQALEKAMAALEKSERENGAGHPNTIMSLEILGLVYQAKGDAKNAESSFLRALSIVKKSAGLESEEAAKIMNNLAGLYYAQNRYQQAASFFKQALPIVEKSLPAGDPRVSMLRRNIEICEEMQTGKSAVQSYAMSEAAGEGKAESGQIPAVTNAPPVNMVQDLVPQEIKESMAKQLAQQNIFISDFKPGSPVVIENKGIVFPYFALKKGKGESEPQKIVVLFAAINNPEKPNAVVFQQCRLISYTSYRAALEKGGLAQLTKEIKEVFSGLYL